MGQLRVRLWGLWREATSLNSLGVLVIQAGVWTMAGVALRWWLNLPVAVAVILGIGGALAGVGVAIDRRIKSGRSSSVGVPGWDSKVTFVTHPNQPSWGNLVFRLFAPDQRPARGEVRCRLMTPSGQIERAAAWGGMQDPGRPESHYALLWNPTLSRNRMPDGQYSVAWVEAYGVGWRALHPSHGFTVENGAIKGAKPE